MLKWVSSGQTDPTIGAIQITILNCTVHYAKFIKKKEKRWKGHYLMEPPLLELQVNKLHLTHQFQHHTMHGGHVHPQQLQLTLQN